MVLILSRISCACFYTPRNSAVQVGLLHVAQGQALQSPLPYAFACYPTLIRILNPLVAAGANSAAEAVSLSW